MKLDNTKKSTFATCAHQYKNGKTYLNTKISRLEAFVQRKITSITTIHKLFFPVYLQFYDYEKKIDSKAEGKRLGVTEKINYK